MIKNIQAHTTNIYCGHEPDSPDPDGMRISKQATQTKSQRRVFQKKAKPQPHTQEVKDENYNKKDKAVVEKASPPKGTTTRYQNHTL